MGLFGLGGNGTVALPGGARLQQPVAPQAGRVFNVTQNLTTGAISVRPRAQLNFTHPVTGSTIMYRNMGRPILWSGDLAATKRVRKAAARARRSRPR